MRLPVRIRYAGAQPILLQRAGPDDPTLVVPIALADLAQTRFVELEAIVAAGSTGSTFTAVPTPILAELGIAPVTLAALEIGDGTVVERDMAEVTLRMGHRQCTTSVIFVGSDEPVLLGQLVLHTLLLTVDPRTERLIPVSGWQRL